MTCEHIAGVCLGIVLTSAAAMGQQSNGTATQAPASPASKIYEIAYPLGGVTPWHREQSRTGSAGREVVIETTQSPGLDGGLEPLQQTVMETTRSGAGAETTSRDVFGFGSRQRRLLETARTERTTSANGNTSTVLDVRLSDADGRLALAARQIEETRLVAPGSRQTETTMLVPGINEAVSERERTQSTERRVDQAVVRLDSARLVPDLNGGWQAAETRTGEIRDVGPSERLSEETVQRRDASGQLAVAERSYTRQTEANGREQVDIETYSQDGEGFARSDGRLALLQRVHRTTTPGVDGGSSIVEEVEGRSPAALGDPMHVIRRTVTTVRRIGSDRWTRETQVFAPDANGRMTLVFTGTEDTTEN